MFIFNILSTVRVHLWDLSGQLEYSEVRNELYGGTHACILVFDVTNRNSFESLDFWLKETVRYGVGAMHTVVVANKVNHLKLWWLFLQSPTLPKTIYSQTKSSQHCASA